MSTRSSTRILLSPIEDPERLLSQRNQSEPSLLFDLEKDDMAGQVPPQARTWLEKEPPNSITTWNDLVSKFVNRFFPPSKTTNLQNEIMRFQQRFGETFSEAWDRFKDLLNKCPYHGFSSLHQIHTFYNSLNQSEQDSLNSAANGFNNQNQAQPNVPSLEKMMFQHMRSTEAKMQQMQDYNNQQMQHLKTQNTNMANMMGQMQKVLMERPQAGPSVPPPPLSSSKEVERVPESTTDQVLTESTTRVPTSVVEPSPTFTSPELPFAPVLLGF
ncbi:reverse transcriptase domain-containing protein [Tanacetum coccineum]